MGSVIEDLQAGAEWVAKALKSSGYRADFSPESLWEIDRFFDEQAPDGQPRRGGLLDRDLGMRLFCLGGYVGEVARRHVGGDWQPDVLDPDSEVDVRLVLANGTEVWPVQRVMKRFRNGPEDGIAAYGFTLLGLNAGAPPTSPAAPPKRRWFGRG